MHTCETTCTLHACSDWSCEDNPIASVREGVTPLNTCTWPDATRLPVVISWPTPPAHATPRSQVCYPSAVRSPTSAVAMTQVGILLPRQVLQCPCAPGLPRRRRQQRGKCLQAAHDAFGPSTSASSCSTAAAAQGHSSSVQLPRWGQRVSSSRRRGRSSSPRCKASGAAGTGVWDDLPAEQVARFEVRPHHVRKPRCLCLGRGLGQHAAACHFASPAPLLHLHGRISDAERSLLGLCRTAPC